VQLACSATDSLTHGLRMVSHGDRLAAFEAGFHHATHVILAAFVAVLVAQVHLHPRDVITESVQRLSHYTPNLSIQCYLTFDVVVGANLYLHSVFLLWLWLNQYR
jgi:hypothetical protein